MLTMLLHFFFVDAFVGRNDIYLVDLVGQHLLFCWRRWVLLMDIATCILVQYSRHMCYREEKALNWGGIPFDFLGKSFVVCSHRCWKRWLDNRHYCTHDKRTWLCDLCTASSENTSAGQWVSLVKKALLVCIQKGVCWLVEKFWQEVGYFNIMYCFSFLLGASPCSPDSNLCVSIGTHLLPSICYPVLWRCLTVFWDGNI